MSIGTRARFPFAVLLVLTLALGACASPSSTAPPPTTSPTAEPDATATPAARVDVTIGNASQPAVATGAFSAAMQAQGDSNVVATQEFFQQSELAAQALLQDDIEVLHIGVLTPINAILGGADLVIFAVDVGNDWVLVAENEIATPQDLAGKNVGIHSETSTATAMLAKTYQDNGIDPGTINTLIVPGSANRAQAILQGQLDATPLLLQDVGTILEEAPGKFHVLVDWADIPLASGVLAAKRDWYEANLDAATELVRRMIATNTAWKADPSLATDFLVEQFPDSSRDYLASTAEEYLSRGLWPTDGGAAFLGDEFVAAIELLKSTGSIPADASDDPSTYVDLRAMDAALQR